MEKITLDVIFILVGIIALIFGIVCLFAVSSYLIDFISLYLLKFLGKFCPDFLYKYSHILFNEHYHTNENKYVPLNDLYKLRKQYAAKLQKYYKKNTPHLELSNDNVYLTLYVEDRRSFFYCRNISKNIDKREIFLLCGDTLGAKAEVMTIWGIFDMEFDDSTNFQSLYDLFGELYPKNSFRGRKIYLSRPYFSKENHYTMIIKLNETPQILCTKKFNSIKKIHNKAIPKTQFVVNADTVTIIDILADKQLEQILEFEELYEALSQRNDCTVEYIKNESLEEKSKEDELINDKNLDKNENISVDLDVKKLDLEE